MKKLKNSFIVLLCMMMLTTIVGCGNNQASQNQTPSTQPPKNQTPVILTISAAASLKDSLEEVKKLYAKENPNVTLNIKYGSSEELEKQIEQGANVDMKWKKYCMLWMN